MKMRTTFCVLITLFILLISGTMSEAQTDYMYWVDATANKIQRANFDGTNVQDILTGFGRPVDIAVDTANGKIYWTDRDRVDHTDPAGRSSIQRANLDGTNVEILVIDDEPVKEYIELDISGGKMYWVGWSNKLRRANLDGTNVEDIVTGLNGRGIALDISQGKIYWANLGTNKLQCANLDGSNIQDVLTTDGPHGIALDVAGRKIYWASWASGKIQRANLDGSNLEELVVGLNRPFGIALDSLSGKMYWADNLAGKIQRANLDGTNVEDLVTGLIHPVGIALGIPQTVSLRFDPNAIADQTFSVNIPMDPFYLPRAEGGRSPYTYTLDPIPAGLSFDATRRVLSGTPTTEGTTATTYTATDATGETASLNFTIRVRGTSAGQGLHVEVYQPGVTLTRLPDFQALTPVATFRLLNINVSLKPCEQGFSGFPGLTGELIENFAVRFRGQLNIATAGTYNFALSSDDGSRLYINGSLIIDHDGLATVARGNPGRGSVALAAGLHDVEVQYFQGPCSHLGLQWFWQPPGGTEEIVPPEVLYLPETTGEPPTDDVYMYWASWALGSIQRGKLDGTHIQDLVTGLRWPRDVALDIAQNKMYWVDANTDKVQRANLDGSNVQDLVNTQGQPFGVAVDTTNGKMYWSTWFPNKIRRANLDGSNIEDFVTTGLMQPEDIALDLSGGKIYWTDTLTNKIQRANLDGTRVEDLVTRGLSYPLCMTLDIAGGKMYWTNTSFHHPRPWPGLDKIQRANLDGTDVEDLVTTGLVLATGIDLDLSDGKIYWTDAVENKIQRANLDGSSVEDVIVYSDDAPINPNGLAIGIPQVPPSDGLRFDPNVIADQNFTVGTEVSLTLPTATGGTPPYTYGLTPSVPAGLYFDPIADGPRFIGGTPTAALPATPFTYTATDATGASVSLTFTITIEDGGLNLDVNGDGKVDVLDLVWVAVAYQMRGDGLRADVNADGVVDIQDLIAVAEGIDAGAVLSAKVAEEVLLAAEAAAAALDGVAGAPVMGFNTPRQVVSGVTAHGNVAAALADARTLGTGDVRLRKWMPLLEGLLQQLAEMGAIPETTALLPNYPNPFNPETWIPYHLAKDAEVTVTIYDIRGVAVRELTLGHQAAGVYESRGRAAYWDGRNQIGEKVASGLYFYTLTAGEFSATRKLLIAK